MTRDGNWVWRTSFPKVAWLSGLALCSSMAFAQTPGLNYSQGAPKTPTDAANGEFARLVITPSSCDAARRFGDQQLFTTDPYTGARVPGPTCRAVKECHEVLISQIAAAIEYLKRQPSVMESIRVQQLTSTPKEIEPVFASLTRAAASLQNLTNATCELEWEFINKRILKSFTVFTDVGTALLNNLRSSYEADEAEYQELMIFNDKYEGREQFERARDLYHRDFDKDDVASMIRDRAGFMKSLEEARNRKVLLERESEQIVNSERSLSQFAGSLVHDGLDKFANKQVPQLVAALKGELEQLRVLPPARRGSVSASLQILNTRISEIESTLNDARSQKARMEEKRLIITRHEVAARRILQTASRDELKGLFDEQFVKSATAVINRFAEFKSLDLWVLRDRQRELLATEQELDELEQRVAAAQAKYDRAAALDDKRRSILERSGKTLAYFSPPDVQGKLSGEGNALLKNLKARRDELSRLGTLRIIERPDYNETMAGAEDLIEKLQRVQAEVIKVGQLTEGFAKVKGKIEGREQPLDAVTSTRFNELGQAVRQLEATKLPLSVEVANQLSQTQIALTEVENTSNAYSAGTSRCDSSDCSQTRNSEPIGPQLAAKPNSLPLDAKLAQLDPKFLSAEIMVRAGISDFPRFTIAQFVQRVLRSPMDNNKLPTIGHVTNNDNEYKIEILGKVPVIFSFTHILSPPVNGRAVMLHAVDVNGNSMNPKEFMYALLAATQ